MLRLFLVSSLLLLTLNGMSVRAASPPRAQLVTANLMVINADAPLTLQLASQGFWGGGQKSSSSRSSSRRMPRQQAVGGQRSTTAAPEPGTIIMMISSVLGILAAGVMLQRKGRRSAASIV